jgi:serine phosphatase RsbU (regulator of sigma subunit)
MRREAPGAAGLVEYAVATVTLPGELESGDRHIVIPTAAGTLIAVVDGLGHGTEAAEAARVAAETLENCAEESVIALVRRCHKQMETTRGAVMSLASFHREDHTVTWLSVGNVEGVLLHTNEQTNPPREHIVMRGGVVGFRLPPLQAVVIPVSAGDILIFATDGIRSGFDDGLNIHAPLQHLADTICSQYTKGTDDALVLVARYLGDGP